MIRVRFTVRFTVRVRVTDNPNPSQNGRQQLPFNLHYQGIAIYRLDKGSGMGSGYGKG